GRVVQGDGDYVLNPHRCAGFLMAEVLTAPDLQELPAIRHGFFTAQWGDCGLSDTCNLMDKLKNRAGVAAYLSVPEEKLLSCFQIHSAEVVTVTMPWPVKDRPQAD